MSGGTLRQRVQAYLREHHVMTLATSGDEGPWAAAVFYVHEGNALYFLSAPTSRHCRNLAKNPRVSATIQEDTSDWKAIKGIQMEGIASRLSGDQEERIRRLYGAKFPLVAESADAPGTTPGGRDGMSPGSSGWTTGRSGRLPGSGQNACTMR